MTPSRRTLLATGLASGLAGLSSPLRAATPKVLTVAAFPLVDEIVKAAQPHWQRLHPEVELRVISRQYLDHHTAMTTALSTATYLPDVMALEVSYVGRFAQGGGLEDLARPPYDLGRFKNRFVPYAYEQARTRSGGMVAVPADVGPGTLLYRADILAKAGVSEEDLTRSWDHYIAAGTRIKKATGAYTVGHVQQVKDIVLAHGVGPGEGRYYDQDSNALATTPRFVHAFEIALKMRRAGLDAKVAAWSNEWAEGFKRGTLATELSGAWIVGQLSSWVAPQTAGRWRAAQFPEGAYAPYGGAFYALPRRGDASRKALAWDFVQMMTLTPELQFSAFKAYDAFPALVQTHDDPFFEQPLPFLGGQKARLLWRDAARKIVAPPVHKQNNFADEVVNTELDNVLERGKDIPSALADAQRLLQRRALR